MPPQHRSTGHPTESRKGWVRPAGNCAHNHRANPGWVDSRHKYSCVQHRQLKAHIPRPWGDSCHNSRSDNRDTAPVANPQGSRQAWEAQGKSPHAYSVRCSPWSEWQDMHYKSQRPSLQGQGMRDLRRRLLDPRHQKNNLDPRRRYQCPRHVLQHWYLAAWTPGRTRDRRTRQTERQLSDIEIGTCGGYSNSEQARLTRPFLPSTVEAEHSAITAG
jgi:hypothetical protein